jgi:hypothetical protein
MDWVIIEDWLVGYNDRTWRLAVMSALREYDRQHMEECHADKDGQTLPAVKRIWERHVELDNRVYTLEKECHGPQLSRGSDWSGPEVCKKHLTHYVGQCPKPEPEQPKAKRGCDCVQFRTYGGPFATILGQTILPRVLFCPWCGLPLAGKEEKP